MTDGGHSILLVKQNEAFVILVDDANAHSYPSEERALHAMLKIAHDFDVKKAHDFCETGRDKYEKGEYRSARINFHDSTRLNPNQSNPAWEWLEKTEAEIKRKESEDYQRKWEEAVEALGRFRF